MLANFSIFFPKRHGYTSIIENLPNYRIIWFFKGPNFFLLTF